VAVRVHNNCRACNVRTKDPSDKGVCLCPLAAYADRVRFASATRIADIDIVVTCGKLAAGTKTQRDVEVARIAAIKRKSTVSCVAIAAGVANEGVNTDCRVVLADVVVKKRLTADCNIVAAGRIAGERIKTVGCVESADGVAERARAPVAVLFVPLSLASRAKKPMAVLKKPTVLL
jgi:hypothetical protein